MEMSSNLWVVLAACLLTVIGAHEDHDHEGHDHEAFGEYHQWRKSVCERKDQALFDDIEECFQKEPKMVKDATDECIAHALPSAKGKERDFEMAACQNPQLFIKFDQCFEKYEQDADFKEKAELDRQTMECYKAVVVKYKLDELLSYFDDASTEKEE